MGEREETARIADVSKLRATRSAGSGSHRRTHTSLGEVRAHADATAQGTHTWKSRDSEIHCESREDIHSRGQLEAADARRFSNS